MQAAAGQPGADEDESGRGARRWPRWVGAALVAGAALGACSSDGGEGAPAGGDVSEACAQRQTWTRGTSTDCLKCTTGALQAACGCEAESDMAGACEGEAQAVRAQEGCLAGSESCLLGCKPDDCGCLAACYEGADECRRLAGARDGCVARSCDAVCR